MSSEAIAKRQAAPAMGKTTARTHSMAERRLEQIYARQLEVQAQLERSGASYSLGERDRILNEVFTAYHSFTLDHPEYVYGFILYGKFLRSVDQAKMANIKFAQANQLDPHIAVVKQQMGNYLVETGDFELALPYFVAALELEPNQAIYNYELGELLSVYRSEFIEQAQMPAEVLDEQMLASFQRAAELEPENEHYQLRYAEAFFDAESVQQWNRALAQWEYVESQSESDLDADIAALQKARVLIQLNDLAQARETLMDVQRPSLESSRQELLTNLH